MLVPADVNAVDAAGWQPLHLATANNNVDAMKAFATFVNANGGIGCRKLKVRTFDSHLDAAESKNGQIDSCSTSFAMVGGNVQQASGAPSRHRPGAITITG